MPTVRRNLAVRSLWKAHRWLFKVSGGRLGGRLGGFGTVMLTTTGRTSHAQRQVMLSYLPEGASFLVVGSNAGEPRHPAWLLNLRVEPRATVNVGTDRHRVTARELEGTERERAWERFIAIEPAYGTYQNRTTRRIPVVSLDPT